MKINEHTALCTPKILLVPYSPHHVPTYHTWMQDPALQAATASEPLTLAEEYAMQASWRTDADKLTFIVCTPPSPRPEHVTAGKEDAPEAMIGDVNLFLNPDDEEEGNEEGAQALVGEIEIMIAVKERQGKGLGREVLLVFMCGKTGAYLKYLRVKIDKDNARSIKLFESVGFTKVSQKPNYFGELELRWSIPTKSTEVVEAMMGEVPQSTLYK